MAKPVVLERRRIVTADPAIAGSKQPFHAAEALPLERAETLIARCRVSSEKLATNALRGLVDRPGVAVAAIVIGSGRQLPDLAATLKSHALIHTAEGEFFREVLAEALGFFGVPVIRVREREIRHLQTRIAALGKALGPPWTQDEKLASLAAWTAVEF